MKTRWPQIKGCDLLSIQDGRITVTPQGPALALQPGQMADKRWAKVFCEEAKLTAEEISEGWHFCKDEKWPGLLVGPGMPEFGKCQCK